VAIQAVIFDFDGLLVDTEGTMLASWQFEWRQHGLELDTTTFFADHGGDVTGERYADLARAVGAGYDRQASHERRVAFRNGLNAELGLLPGIARWLGQAGVLGLRLAVASSSPRSWVRGLLSRLGYLEKFEVIACGDEVAAPKPDPAVYTLALARLGLAAGHAVAVEDAAHGVAAAHRAGLPCVAIPGKHADVRRFAAAELVLSSAAELDLADVLGALGPASGPGTGADSGDASDLATA
jgi:HAD superfamily hydrolase (TIGR01509 family)